MMVVFDATMMLLLMRPNVRAPLDPATGQPVEHAEERIAFLVQGLEKARTRILIPTPVLSEILVKAGSAGPGLVRQIQEKAVFRIAPFDTIAAIEVAAMTHAALEAGDKRGGAGGDWAKIKYDRQIVAIAKVHRAHTIYTDDEALIKFSQAQNLNTIRLAEISLPPEVAQGTLDLSPKNASNEGGDAPSEHE
ncbi:MAG TPA: hypothetical protein VLE23_00295 [Geminicoccaceae bacterium]|nr:hypothetical protein [Geminicoccaceae bacterium]